MDTLKNSPPVIFGIQFPQVIYFKTLEVKCSKQVAIYSFIFPNIENPCYIQLLLMSLAKKKKKLQVSLSPLQYNYSDRSKTCVLSIATLTSRGGYKRWEKSPWMGVARLPRVLVEKVRQGAVESQGGGRPEFPDERCGVALWPRSSTSLGLSFPSC